MSAQKSNLLEYLPPEHQQKVLTLIQRLQEQTESKNHYMGLYEEARGKMAELQLKYNQLKDQNQLLKQQIHNSFSIVAQVRKNFKNTEKAPKSKPREDEWEDQESEEEEVEELEQTAPVSKTLSAQKPPKPQHPSTPVMHLTQKKPNRNSTQEMNRSQVTSNRSQELESLRKEVRQLQEEKRAKEHREKSIKEKHRLVDEIKNRYKKQGSDRGDVSATFEEDDYSVIETRREESEKGQPKKPVYKEVAKQNRRVDNMEQKSQARPRVEKSGVKGPVVTEADYSEVMDMINDYNL